MQVGSLEELISLLFYLKGLTQVDRFRAFFKVCWFQMFKKKFKINKNPVEDSARAECFGQSFPEQWGSPRSRGGHVSQR